MTYTLSELAAEVNGRLIGDADHLIDGVGTLGGAGPSQITFLANAKYRKALESTRAGAVILGAADADVCPANAVVVDDPHLAYAHVSALFAPPVEVRHGMHPSAVVSGDADVHPTAWIGAHSVVGPEVTLGANVVIGPGCYVGGHCSIGADTRLVANVTIYHGCTLGERVLVHAGAVIGSDGFGFANDKGRWVKVHQLGGVRIGDDVEIGANTTIDRGAVEDTIIGEGVKLDNLIQIAHNVRIGAHTAMAGCVGIAGSSTIGEYCAIGGGAGILGHLQVADRVTVTAMSLVTKSIREPGVYSSGTPLQRNEEWHRNYARFKQLDDMARTIRRLEKELETLKKG